MEQNYLRSNAEKKKFSLRSDSFSCEDTFGSWHTYVIELLFLEEKLNFFEMH